MHKQISTVSVIIPTYNRDRFISRAILSVISQTYRDFELIIVDDASTDNTTEVVSKFRDERICYIQQSLNRGASATRNEGIKLANGSLITFLDDDDEWLPEKLEKQINKFKKVSSKVGLVYSGSELIDGKDNSFLMSHAPKYKGNVSQHLLLGPTICGSHTALIKKECFEKVGMFDETLKSCQDWDMWKRISDYYDFDFVPENLSRTYIHQNQISCDFSSLIPGRTKMIEKHIKDFKMNPDIFVIHLKRLGKLNCLNGTYKDALNWFGKALKINIFEIFKILAWCFIELPKDKKRIKKEGFKKYEAHYSR